MFKAQCISLVNGPVSESIKESPRDLVLKTECKKQPGQKLFVALEKNEAEVMHYFIRKSFIKKLAQ